MSLPGVAIEQNLQRLKTRIALACERANRVPENVRLVAVTKSVGIEEIRVLRALGITEFGENRVETIEEKVTGLDGTAYWHMIGNVQRRKAGAVALWFDCVDAIDRIEAADALQRRCIEVNKTLTVLAEVNVSGEPTKHGFAPHDLPGAVAAIRKMDRLRVQGLMTMAPLTSSPELTRPVFAHLRKLARELGLNELSMGMSNDFEVAVEEGATQIRIGSALFETEESTAP